LTGDEITTWLAALAYGVVLVGIIGFFGLWVHRAQTEKGRALTMGLYIFFGAFGFFGFLFGAGGASRSLQEGQSVTQREWIWIAVGLGIGLALIKPTRQLLARGLPFDPNSRADMVALAIMLAATGFGIVSLFYEQTLEGELEPANLLPQTIGFVALAYFGVGLFVKRSFREASHRLGLVRLTPTQLLISLGMVIPTFIISMVAGVLVQVFQPELADRIQENLQLITTNFDSFWGALLIGVSAGVGEEIFFRGAIQPRFGIIFTAAVFALIHTQYGASFVTLGAFGIGLLWGYQRQRWGTTSAILTHAVYDIIAVMAIQLG
jgi:uncharacterized protein